MAKDSAYFKIPLVIYPFNLQCFFNKSDAFVQKELSKESGGKSIPIEQCRFEENQDGHYTLFTNGVLYIRLRNIPTTCYEMGILSHEILHVVLTVLDEVGMKLQIGTSDEAYTYLMGYLTQEMHKNLNKYY